jgi:hypothetical protein
MKNMKRDLRAIVADIHAVLKRGTADIIDAGRLLCEAKAQVDHGDWLAWLEREFSLSERSAQKYMLAYTWATKNAPDADLTNLSPSLIYEMSNKKSLYNQMPDAVAAILKEATEKRVGSDRGWEILMATVQVEPTPGPEAEPASVEPEPESEQVVDSTDDPNSILDGPPPELPPAEPAPAIDFVLPAFEQAIKQLKELQTKPLHKFVVTYHSADDIAAVADFLHQIATAKKAKAAA